MSNRGLGNGLLIQFAYLQLLDLMTTVAFLVNGVGEGNPLVQWVLVHSANPIGGLVAMKVLAVLLGFYCWWMRRVRVLSRINVLFAVVVAWNVAALIMKSFPKA